MFAEAALKPITRSLACELKQAVILTLRLCTRSSDAVLKKLVFEKHFFEMSGDNAGCLGFPCSRRLKRQMAESVSGFCARGMPTSFRIFVRCYRQVLDISGTSPYLLPSVDDEPLGASTMSMQQTVPDAASGCGFQVFACKGDLDEGCLRT